MNTPRTEMDGIGKALGDLMALADKATPGEWRVLIDGPGSKDVGTSEDGGIATCFTHGLEHDPTDAANAYLITAAINFIRQHGPALAALVADGGWLPIETAPVGKEMFVARAFGVSNGFTGGKPYTTDPWCVWQESAGQFARWPHHFPPTHFLRLPPNAARAGGG